jgi:signal transduction histidine kinase
LKSLRSALIFIGFAGIVFGLLMMVVIFTSDRDSTPEIDAAVTLLPSWSFIGTGLFAWWRRPNNRSGSLMVLIGFAWLLIPMSVSNVTALFAVGLLTANIAWVLFAQLLLVFPGGRIETKSHRTLLTLLWIDAILFPIITVMVSGPQLPYDRCEDCPPNPLDVTNNLGLARVFDSLTSIFAVLLLIVLVAMLIRRYRSYGSVGRDAIRPVLGAGALMVLTLGLLVFVQALNVPESVSQTLFLITVVLMSAVPFTFLFGLLRSRFSSAGAVSELIATLGDSTARNLDIRDALAEALGDPTLQFLYWLPERQSYVDDAGQAVELPERNSGRGWSSVEHDGDLIAAIVFDDSLEDNDQLIRATGSAAALALRNQRLEAELRANVEELRASRMRIVQTSDAARRELERNLHDGAQQHLVSMALTLRMATDKIDTDPAAARELLTQASTDLSDATTELRELARGIHPAILTDRGLAAALDALASRSVVPVELGEVPEVRLPQPVESAAYFVVAEALTNVARYSQATKASVSVARNNGNAVIEISDDGIGGADINGGTGLRGLQDRVAALDGKLTIESPAGSGTKVRALFPCE